MTPLDHALTYAARGWRVVPIMPGEKRPALSEWQKKASCDIDTVTKWWTRWPEHGIGIATGPASGFFVLDIDSANGKVGDESLADLEATFEPLPPTVEVLTGSGGRHLYFQWPEGYDIRNDQAGRLGRDLDIRGDGGQVVAPPTLHPCGTRYEWEASSAPDMVEMAEAPLWLLELLTSVPDPQAHKERQLTERADGELLPGDRFAASVTWEELLCGDGASFIGRRVEHSSGEAYELWSRPAMTGEEGFVPHQSATLGYKGSDVLKLFTPNWQVLNPSTGELVTLEDGRTYDKFGYFAATRHGGDHGEAARAIKRTEDDAWLLAAAPADGVVQLANEEAGPGNGTAEPTVDPHAHAHLIDWSEFWAGEHATEEWAIFPIIPAGRSAAIYAPAKAGKSTIILAICAAAATGRKVLGSHFAPEPVSVLYLDYEMTEGDLFERLSELGYSEADDLSLLHYAMLPTIGPLDTPEAAQALLTLALAVNAKVVVIDTFGRAVQGDENEADTVRAFYRNTGMTLKAAGVAVVRADHSGKNLEKGQRGSSAKNDDVDVVWQLTRRDDGVRMQRTHSRVSWVPENVNITRIEDADGVVEYTSDAKGGWPAGTKEMMDILDELEAPIDITVREARSLMAEHRIARRTTVVTAAVKCRRIEAERAILLDLGGREIRAGINISVEGGEQDSEDGETQDESAGQKPVTPQETVGSNLRVPMGSVTPPEGGNAPRTHAESVSEGFENSLF